MAKKTSPTARTLAYLRSKGFEYCGVTERWNAYAKVRVDLLGFCDLIYLDIYAPQIVAVQATSASNHAARRTKIKETSAAKRWLVCGGRVEVWSWSAKPRKKGGRKYWTPRVELIQLGE